MRVEGKPHSPSAITPLKDPVPIVQEAECAPGQVWTGGKSRPHRDSIPDLPARSSVTIPTAQSLYRLSYRAHNLAIRFDKNMFLYAHVGYIFFESVRMHGLRGRLNTCRRLFLIYRGQIINLWLNSSWTQNWVCLKCVEFNIVSADVKKKKNRNAISRSS